MPVVLFCECVCCYQSEKNESGCQRSKIVITHSTDFFQRIDIEEEKAKAKLSIDRTLEKKERENDKMRKNYQSTRRFVHYLSVSDDDDDVSTNQWRWLLFDQGTIWTNHL